MQLFLRTLHKPYSHSRHRHYCHRAYGDGTVKWVRDRGLDHAVEREKNLKPLLNLKNLIKLEPSKSLPVSIITEQRDKLKIPFRPVEFIRKYPSIFQEFFPGNIGIHPHVKLTPEVLEIDAEEQLLYQTESYKQVVADRLSKLLMISRINKLPLKIIDILKWDLGLPHDYVKSVVPEFPDCFRVVGSRNNLEFSYGFERIDELELVCWSNELAVSVMEKKSVDGEKIVFSLQYSRGFEMDKKMKKWVDDWQKLPYISPYENASRLSSTSDESDKWSVAVLHEVISLFNSKKVERDDMLSLGECLGIRSRFKRALLNHPGIFYVSSKNHTHTVVLREGYKRGLLIGSDPLMDIRGRYIHLMHLVKEDRKVNAVPSESKHKKKETSVESKVGEGEENKEAEEDKEEIDDSEPNNVDASDDDFEEDEDDDDEEEEEEEINKRRRGAHRSSLMNRGRQSRKMDFNIKEDMGSRRRAKPKGQFSKEKENSQPRYARERGMQDENSARGSSEKRLNFKRGIKKLSQEKKAYV